MVISYNWCFHKKNQLGMFKRAEWKYEVQEPAANTVVAKLVRLFKSCIFHCLLLLNDGGYIVQVCVCTGTQNFWNLMQLRICLPNAIEMNRNLLRLSYIWLRLLSEYFCTAFIFSLQPMICLVILCLCGVLGCWWYRSWNRDWGEHGRSWKQPEGSRFPKQWYSYSMFFHSLCM